MKILLVTADTKARSVLCAFLSERDDELTLRTRAQRAFDGRTYACVMIDLGLGAEALGLVRQARTRDEETVVVVLAGAGDPQPLAAALRAGADELIPLPLDRPALEVRMQVIERLRTGRVEHRRLEKNLALSRSRSRTILESVHDGLLLLDEHGSITFANSCLSDLTGFEGIELIGERADEILRRANGEPLLDLGQPAADTPNAIRELRTKRGELQQVQLTIAPIAGEGNRNEHLAVLRAVGDSVSRTAQAAYERERAFFRQLFQNSPSGIVILDTNDLVVEANERFYHMFRLRKQDLVGQPLSDLIVPEDHRQEAAELSQEVYAMRTVECETVRLRKDGTPIEVSILGHPIELADQRIGAYGVYTDISDRKRAQQQLLNEAFHDPLTGLPNRNLLLDRLRRALAQAERGDSAFAVLFLDLDGFKVINDRFGHAAGDAMLVAVARRLEACLRPGDTTARYGGDEFVVLLENLTRKADAELIAGRILISLRAPLETEGQTLTTSASIGIVVSSAGFSCDEDVLRAADRAMYRAKATGKDRYELAASPEAASGRIVLAQALQQDLAEDGLDLRFLPIASAALDRVLGFATVVVWEHPERGTIAPPALRAIVDQTGLAPVFTEWLVRRACVQLALWQKQYPERDGLLLHLGIPPAAIFRKGFVERLQAILEQTGAPPAALLLALPEHVLGDGGALADVLWQLRSLGLRLAIEGFGSGTVSLPLLQRLPLDALRLDAKLARDPQPGSKDAEAIRAMCALAGSLGLKVIATGIGTGEQLAGIRRAGVRQVQGDGVASDLDPQAVERWLATGTPSVPGCPEVLDDDETHGEAGETATP